jgi:uroporphyrinogen decarboxylase
MNSKERVKQALSFSQPDRVPRFWPSFWPSFLDRWKACRAGDPRKFYGTDIRIVAANETAWPSRAGIVEERGEMAITRSGWGELKRTVLPRDSRSRETMGHLLEPAITSRVDPDSIEFEDPMLDSRYEAAERQVAAWKDRCFLFAKTGGPYLRAAFMRGEVNLWYDVADDPQWVSALVGRVTDHLTAVGLEELRRFDLYDTGIGIYDDVAASWGPFVGPQNYERIFLPHLRRMVKAYKEAGAARVMHHADGNVLPLLDMWVDAGIDAINPVEYRTGMDPVEICERYRGRLACVGGLDNCEILPRGDRAEVREHLLHLLTAGSGFVIGPHSIGPDISIETMDYVHELLEEHGGCQDSA